MSGLEMTVPDAARFPPQQPRSRRRSAGEAGPAKPDVLHLAAAGWNVVTWHLTVFVVISAAIPAVALVGWILNVPSLESGIPGLTRMNPVSALWLLAINAGWILRRRKSCAILGKALALAVACCALWRLSEYCFSSGSHLDFILFHQQVLGQAFPNKIAPNTALVLLTLGLSVGMHSHSGKWLQFSSWLALASGTFTLFALLGYAYRAASLYGIPRQTPMALNTCVAALFASLVLLADSSGFRVTKPLLMRAAGGFAARRLLPAALLLPVAMGFVKQLGLRFKWFAPDYGSALFATGNIALICFVIQRTASRLNDIDFERALQQAAVQDANQQLSATMERLVLQARELTIAQELLRIEVTRDPLTGAFNRRHLENLLRLRFEQPRSPSASFGILMIDIDHFKLLNDSFGHHAGDLALREVARIMIDSVRDGDTICRYGGEEFVAVVAQVNSQSILDCAERIRNTIGARALRIQDDLVCDVTISIGCALDSDSFSSPDELLQAADAALYCSKNLGRNRSTVWSQAARTKGAAGVQ
jgi:diguanylate cyclase (GGDEF)-like protein